MKKSIAIVTGGCGFIGSHLADYLIKLNFEVVVIDNLSVGRRENISHLNENSKFTFVDADISSELQGRLPIRVELRALTEEDFVRILKETRANLVEQYKALIGTENVTLDFTEDAITEVAKLAARVNETVENIGARRLQTVMERLLEEISFEAEDHAGETIMIDAAYVRERLETLAGDTDLSKYIL